MPVLRWTKPKPSSFTGPKACELRQSGKVLLKAQQDRMGSWFWYVVARDLPSANTSHEPCGTLAEAQAQAVAWLKAPRSRTLVSLDQDPSHAR